MYTDRAISKIQKSHTMFLVRLLWRKSKKTTRRIPDQTKAELKTEVKTELKTEVKAEVKTELKTEVTHTETKLSEVIPKATDPMPDTTTNTSASKDAPVRLLLVEEFVKFSSGVPFYEVVPKSAFIEVDFEEFLNEYHKNTAVISWRWMAPKPNTEEAALLILNTDKNPVPLGLVKYVDNSAQRNTGIKYVWLDWSCAPQYPGADVEATMREINRSGAYYQKAAEIIVWCYASVDADIFAFSDYFGRAWTLSERLYRSRSQGYLRGTDVVPLCLTEALECSNPSPLRVVPNVSQWNVECTREIEEIRMQERLTMDAMIGFATKVLMKRYPLLDAAFVAINDQASQQGFLAKVLTAPVCALTSTALMVKAASEWIKNPDAATHTQITFKLGMNFDNFAAFLVASIIQNGRMRINNLPDKSLSNSLEDLVGIESGLREPGLRNESLKKLDDAAERIYKLAMSSRTLEVANDDWLGRYLCYENGNYNAFVAQDKLFAVYKLFDGILNRTYEQTDQVWRDLCSKADPSRVRFLSSNHADEPWLKELSVVHSEADVGRPFFAVNTRSMQDKMGMPSSHPMNFGVLAYPFVSSSSSSIVQVFCHKELTSTGDMLTYMLAFNLDARALLGLAKKKTFTLVNKDQGTEIDSHLSLRGRKALEFFESELHGLVRSCSSIQVQSKPFVTNTSNGLFICVRYDGKRNLSKAVVIRTNLSKKAVWSVEAVGAFTGEPQKGSSWGIARWLDNLIKDIVDLVSDTNVHGEVSFACRQFGECEPWSETSELENAHFSSGDDEFFTAWKLDSNTSTHAKNDFTPDLLPKENPEDNIDVDDIADLMVIGKTTFNRDVEFGRVQKAFKLVKKLNGGSNSLSIYYQILQRNYLVDTVMAQQISYFGDLCDILSDHIKQFPSLLEVSMIKQFFDYLVEDMIDAVDYAEDRVSDDVIEHVRNQRRKLMRIVEGDE